MKLELEDLGFKALYPREIDLSLDRMRVLMEKLGHPEERMPPVVHIAGTNGKGSTTAFLRAMIEAAGKTTHVYTSPHLVRFHERVRIGRKGGGRFVEEEALVGGAAVRGCSGPRHSYGTAKDVDGRWRW